VPLVVVAECRTVALSLAVWLSVLTIRFRDFYHLVAAGDWFWDLVYTGVLSRHYFAGAAGCFCLHFNPVAGVINLMRWAVLGDGLDPSYLPVLAGPRGVAVGGLWFIFRG
jgi:ABC-type polysaccharide/polyol phosphate export permease